MGRRWLEKMAASAMHQIKDSVIYGNADTSNPTKLVGSLVTGAVSGALSGKTGGNPLQAALSGMDLGPTVGAIRERGSRCARLASETVDLCETTQTKSQQMVNLGRDIRASLKRFNGSTVDASALETIKELTDGAKLQEAVTIAQGLDQVALSCVDKSIQMIDLMEDSMDALPNSLESMIDEYVKQQQQEEVDGDGADTELSLRGVDKDLEDVRSSIGAMQKMNLATAFEIGLRAFEQLSAKAQTSRKLFASIQGFSTSVLDITHDFSKLDVVSLYSKIKDILMCIRLSEVMRALAEATKKIVQALIDLFRATASKISSLWSALAFAKNCMSDCLEYGLQAKNLILDTHDKSLSLVTKSKSVLGQLQTVKFVNKESFRAIQDLRQGEDLKAAIDLAIDMDEKIVECTFKVTSMVDRVQEGFGKLPDVITEGLDAEAEGRDYQDVHPRGVDDDIADLEASKEAMEKSDIFTACKTGASGLSSISTKAETCAEMLLSVRDFSENCNSTIESFMGVWDLQSAMTKIQEMCRMVAFGNLMKEFARQIKRLVLAILALLQATHNKICNIELKDIGENLKAGLSNAIGGALGDDVGKMLVDKVTLKNLDQAMGKITGGLDSLFGNKI